MLLNFAFIHQRTAIKSTILRFECLVFDSFMLWQTFILIQMYLVRLWNIKHEGQLKVLHQLYYSQRDILVTQVETVFKQIWKRLQSVWFKCHVVNNTTYIVLLARLWCLILRSLTYSLRKRCPYSELFWSPFFTHLTAFGLNTPYLSVFTPNAARCWKNADQKNSKYGHLLRSELVLLGKGKLIFCCTGSRENYFGSVGQQKKNNNPKFQDRHT